MNAPIITSLLDNDLYKITMQQVVLHQSPGAMVEYRFKCRNIPAIPLGSLTTEIEREIDALCQLQYTDGELEWLSSLSFLKADFIDFLRIFRLQRRFVTVMPANDGSNGLEIVIKGPWLHTIPFEVPILSIVNELYCRRVGGADGEATGERRLGDKIAYLKSVPLNRATPFVFFEFGTRRRYSKAFQRRVVERLKSEVPEYFKGTSNMLLAKEFGLVPIGTMAHEFLQAQQAMGVRLRDFQKLALETWVKEYRGALGIALTDVIGIDAFLSDFDLYFAKLFDGGRHDSGDPVAWGEKMLAHYQKLKINALTKMLTWSDKLDFVRAVSLYNGFADRAKTGYGIGTFLTNDCGIDPLEIVIKMVSCNGQPVAKVSDSPGKGMCSDDAYVANLRAVFGVAA